MHKLKEYIERLNRQNSDLVYGIDDVCGITNTKKLMTGTRANLNGRTFEAFTILNPNEFIFNRRTSRNGEKISLGFNTMSKSCILTEDYCHFRIKKEKENELSSEYLYLFFLNSEFDRYVRFNSWGSATEFFNWDDMCDTPIKLPSLEEQQMIVKEYNCFIQEEQLLLKKEKYLKEIASNIYKEFFVYFKHEPLIESSIGMIPVTWKVGKLTDIMTYAGGQQPPASEFISKPKEDYVRLIQIRDYETDEYVTYIPVSKKNKLCNESDIMLARYGDVGRVCFGLNGAYNVAMAKVTPLKPCYTEYLRCYLDSDSFFQSINEGSERSVINGFNSDNIDSINIPIAPDDYYEKFEKLAAPIFQHRLNIKKQLSIIRDIEKKYLNVKF